MARLMCVANGNFTDAATWAVIDSTSYVESETSLLTSTTAYLTSYTAFTPGAITIDGIAVRIAQRLGTTGTMSVDLYNSTAGASVATSEVTVNMTDVVDSNGNLDGGWMFFKFGAPILLLAATNYMVRFKTSTTAMVIIYGSSANVPSRLLRTTTTQAPVAGDDFFVMGEWTAAATTTTRTMTINSTGSTDYGSASTSQVTPALSISAGGIVLAGTTAATTYTFKLSGNVVVYNGGILRLATSGSRMPTDSSFTWTFDCVANVDFGIDVRRKGEFTAYGASKQRWTLLTSDEAAASTSIQVVSTSGWANNDTLVFAPTGNTATHGETKTVSTVDSATQVTLSAGLTNPHTGTGDVVGEVGNVVSNVKIIGISDTVGTFICFRESSLGVLDNIEVQYWGSSTANKLGVQFFHINTSTNSVTFNSCSFRNPSSTSSSIGNTSSQAAGNLFYITNCVMYNAVQNAPTLTVYGGSTGTPTYNISDNLIVGAGAQAGFSMGLITGAGGTCTNNRISGFTTGLQIMTTFISGQQSALSGHKVHSCSTQGGNFGTAIDKVFTSCDFNRNGSSGVTALVGSNTFTSCNFKGNSSAGITPSLGSNLTIGKVTLNSCTFAGSTGFAQQYGISIGNSLGMPNLMECNLCTFGSGITHTSGDINVSGNPVSGRIILNSCTFASATEITTATYTTLDDISFVGAQRKDDTDGSHLVYVRQGIITPDTSIFRTASPSLRITPKSASIECSNKLFPFSAYVNNGEVCTPSLYVRESVVGDGADYNGGRIKLYVKANYNLGITSDTLLATATIASEGAFELLSAACPAVTDSGVLQFYATCSGTTGWINLDDFSFNNV